MGPPKGLCTFQNEWLTHPKFKHWIKQVPNDVTKACCSVCENKVFSLSSMGHQALISHANGNKHKKGIADKMKTLCLDDFLSTSKANKNAENLHPFETSSQSNAKSCSENSTSFTVDSSSSEAQNTNQTTNSAHNATPSIEKSRSTTVPLAEFRTKEKYFEKDKKTRAEILWCLDCVMNHRSMRSAAKSVDLFKIMFTDSAIANSLELQKSKIGYTLLFGIAPHFKNELVQIIQKCNEFVIGFDESFNKVCQRQQMDVNVRYWDDDLDQVCTRYFTSAFLGSCKAVDLLQALLDSVESLDHKKFFQVSMDGSNVNFKVIKDLRITMKENDIEKIILDLGSCGIHTTHNAFKAAMVATGWKLAQFLRALYNLFKNVPARRALFTAYTKSKLFPMKFCNIRWLENTDVAQRAIDMLPHLRTFIKSVNEDKLRPISNSFYTVEEHMTDPMIGPKLAFFKTIARKVEPFLREFQSDWPLAPFLHSALKSTVISVMERFVKERAIKISVDVEKEENLLSAKHIEVGFETSKEIKKIKSLKEVDVTIFRQDSKKGLKKFVLKMMERSPLKKKLTEAVSCFDPAVGRTSQGRDKLKKLVDLLFENNWISSNTAENVMREFKIISSDFDALELMKKFKRKEERLDTFWINLLDNIDEECKSFRKVLKMTLILSHGNANIERGFSVNAECLVENMLEETLVGHRVIYDSVSALGGIAKVPITKKLILEARNAHSRYQEALKKKKIENKNGEEQISNKRMINTKVRLLASKKAQILEDARKEADSIEKEIVSLKTS